LTSGIGELMPGISRQVRLSTPSSSSTAVADVAVTGASTGALASSFSTLTMDVFDVGTSTATTAVATTDATDVKETGASTMD